MIATRNYSPEIDATPDADGATWMAGFECKVRSRI